MVKEAFICGLGMVLDLAGGQVKSRPVLPTQVRIGQYWNAVGSRIQMAINKETVTIEAAKARQLQLNLGNTATRG